MSFTRCSRCVMPNTRPGITFNEEGVCSACQSHENRKNVDWDARYQELKTLCDKHRRDDGKWDCIIAVSGGKDSTYQVKVMKEDMGMNPLLVNVSNFSSTDAGRRNYRNMLETFDCECLSLDLSPATAKKMFRYSLETYGSPTWYWDRAVYTYPLWIAKKFDIPLLVYGENISYEYGGPGAEDTPSALGQLQNAVANAYTPDDFFDAGVEWNRTYIVHPPAELDKVEPVYLSYFVPWSGTRNMLVAKAYGFKELAHWEERAGYIEQYDQIDAIGYLVHCWMKYPKYGHARVTDVASYWIREGLVSRQRAMELVRKEDYKLDHNVRDDFCAFCGYTETQFQHVIDDWYNPAIFEQIEGQWVHIESR